MKFEPTPQQTELAHDVLSAKAFYNIVKDVFDRFITDLLATGKYRYGSQYSSGLLKDIYNVPQDGILRNPDHLEMMEGKNMPTFTTTVNSLTQFNDALSTLTQQAGYKNRQLAETLAYQDLQNAVEMFLYSTVNIHGVHLLSLLTPEQKENLTEKLLNFFHVQKVTDYFFTNENDYFLAHLVAPFNNDYLQYENTPVARAKFMAYKRFIPMADFLTGTNRETETEQYNHVSGAYAYLPGYLIFRMKEGETWKHGSLQPISAKFRFESATTGEYSSNDIEELEGLLFDDFLANYK